MKLLTKELEKKFEQYPLYSQEGLGGQAKVIAKFFNPVGAGTWLITEGEQRGNGDWEMFGFCHLGSNDMAELGYVSLNELEAIYFPSSGLGIERDLYFPKDITLAEACKREFGYIPSYMQSAENDMEQTM
ncbi:MAG: DUF2958 domain-containing protein [Clostridiales bacterium]|nr:DUF2958 domain-containing protein [Clostridiales bacterium]